MKSCLKFKYTIELFLDEYIFEKPENMKKKNELNKDA
jgi:hypothetical protein